MKRPFQIFWKTYRNSKRASNRRRVQQLQSTNERTGWNRK